MTSGSGWNLWVWLVGVCKEVYRFPHITYPYSSCICSFCSSINTFCSFKKNVFRSCSVHFCNLFNTLICIISNVTKQLLCPGVNV